MDLIDLNLMSTMSEVVLSALLITVLLTDLWTSDENRYLTHLMSPGTVITMAVMQLAVQEQGSTLAFHGIYTADGMSCLSKLVLYRLTFGLFTYSKPHNQVHGIFKGEFYTLSLFALLGMSVMVSTAHFLTAYIGLEPLSLPFYATIALRRDPDCSAEAVFKYFVLGALVSGLLLYGTSMVYGAMGSLEFATTLASSYSELINERLLKLGLVFIVVAVAFKLGAVPFHMWVPDVYHGAPTSVAAFAGTVPKIATIVSAFRILVTGSGTVHHDWSQMFVALVAASLLIGNLAAIMQVSIKRMLVYSTISYMGFILLAFMAGTVDFVAGLYYATTYALTAAVGFDASMVLSIDNTECEETEDLAGLNQRHAWFAFLMLLVMFSTTGTPLPMGFYAKFGVIKALLSAPTAQNATMVGSIYTVFAMFAVAMSLVGASHHLRVVKVMYFDEATHDQPVGSNYAAKSFLSVNVFLLTLRGIMP